MAFGCKWSFVVMKSERKYKPAIKDGRYLVDNIFFDKKTIFNFYFARKFHYYWFEKWVWALRSLIQMNLNAFFKSMKRRLVLHTFCPPYNSCIMNTWLKYDWCLIDCFLYSSVNTIPNFIKHCIDSNQFKCNTINMAFHLSLLSILIPRHYTELVW